MFLGLCYVLGYGNNLLTIFFFFGLFGNQIQNWFETMQLSLEFSDSTNHKFKEFIPSGESLWIACLHSPGGGRMRDCQDKKRIRRK